MPIAPNRTPIVSSGDHSPPEDGAIDTDVSSHFESTPETTPDTISSRLTKTTSEEIPEAFKVNPLFETEENLLSGMCPS